jgi:glycosyltransferase involved in cell wall biosynthesis
LVVAKLVRTLLNKADRVIAASTDIATNARLIYGVDRQIDVIPLAIVPFERKEISRDSLDIGEDRFVMATVGRLISRKGLEDLLRAVRDLDDPRDLLLVIGSGPARESLEGLAVELGIKDRVRFTGWVSDGKKCDLLSISDLYVSTSLHEGFGLVFLEAMHCGLPIVCYNQGGQTDFLEDGKTGVLVPLGKRDAFVEAVRRLKTDREWARSCAVFNRERVKDYYIDRYAERHERLFDEAIRARRRAV